MRVNGTLEILERLHNTASGGPRFKIRVGKVDMVTKPNSDISYALTNYDGKSVSVTYKTYYNRPTLQSIQLFDPIEKLSDDSDAFAEDNS